MARPSLTRGKARAFPSSPDGFLKPRAHTALGSSKVAKEGAEAPSPSALVLAADTLKGLRGLQ
jgi:hypothetical protein